MTEVTTPPSIRDALLNGGACALQLRGYRQATPTTLMSTAFLRTCFDAVLAEMLVEQTAELSDDVIAAARMLRAEIAYLNKPGL